MIKGYAYATCIGVILFFILVGEIKFRIAFNKWWKSTRHGDEPTRVECYADSIPLSMGILFAGMIVVVMILTWNDPI